MKLLTLPCLTCLLCFPAAVPIEFSEEDLGYLGVLNWNEPPAKASRNFAVIRYVRGTTAKDYEADRPAEYDFQAGLDAKVPITSSLNLDLTVNPDFSQVEVDEQVINLTLFDIRLPEKRVFFLENSDIEAGYTLKFSSTANVGISYNYNVVNLLFPFTFINDEPLPAGIYPYGQAQIRLQSDQRRLFSIMGVKFRAQPWGNFSVNVEQNDLSFPEPYGQDRLLLISPRTEINFSRKLFWTTFLQYNTQDDNFNINSRLQSRFRPMSDLYIVYTDNYAVEFWGPKHRALTIKLNNWFNL